MAKKKNLNIELEQKNGELTIDLQRTRADFENFRKNVEIDRIRVKQLAEQAIIEKLLPILDDLDLATANAPKSIASEPWVKGVLNLNKKLEAELAKINVAKIAVKPGDNFNPELHEAVLVEESEGEREVISEILRNGYTYGTDVLRHVVVKVKRI